jgi:hypothetical protein
MAPAGGDSRDWKITARRQDRCFSEAVGAEHPGILYMEYPVYPKTFRMMVLASYQCGYQQLKNGCGRRHSQRNSMSCALI